MENALDRRLHAFREDLADEALRGQVVADRFVVPTPAHICAPVADMMNKPDADAGMDTQALLGEAVHRLERANGWCWVQRVRDGYVGYVRAHAVVDGSAEPTHRVSAPRTFTYAMDDLKSPRRQALSMGSLVTVVGQSERRGTTYALLDNGEAVFANHLIGLDHPLTDPVAVAERLIHTPYLWGGATGFGIDCSGLVAMGHLLCGHSVPRDSDMQAAGLGEPLEGDNPALQRGDLVFWKGHVGMMQSPTQLLHANGHTMDVASEPLADAVARIGYLYGPPTGYRRP
ncbi:MAG: NlpC/P60 family protein [Pseudomonadota bacterium]